MTFPDKSIDTIAATALPIGNVQLCNGGNWVWMQQQQQQQQQQQEKQCKLPVMRVSHKWQTLLKSAGHT